MARLRPVQGREFWGKCTAAFGGLAEYAIRLLFPWRKTISGFNHRAEGRHATGPLSPLTGRGESSE